MGRAIKGGERGVNGEWYEGGKFTPNNPERAKVEGGKPRKARKIEIEPYVWIDAPAGFVSIFSKIEVFFRYDRNAKKFAEEIEAQPFAYYHRNLNGADLDAAEAKLLAFAKAFNRGERVTLA